MPLLPASVFLALIPSFACGTKGYKIKVCIAFCLLVRRCLSGCLSVCVSVIIPQSCMRVLRSYRRPHWDLSWIPTIAPYLSCKTGISSGRGGSFSFAAAAAQREFHFSTLAVSRTRQTVTLIAR
ncbi:hypothetical protein MPTK1_1g04080 [Marchantia polymorpha subsp. ruderalis]|uniref:Secreted protein n=2 Tax=Marchantia polymorpha TaxID=3197 RepID=A0AAF6ALB4_MARPO|nr:hypothetical protein MARPO_0005s0199 [Marchantia polymorpha]BBM97234.1 hypothetical protein Mp_1g04080 [Marchantia polymorpha subsp. ruderalis]|eukprot:PTQ48574.1 hypothetical protein MARPO_0005s0199 [Marchantia polymorpha]